MRFSTGPHTVQHLITRTPYYNKSYLIDITTKQCSTRLTSCKSSSFKTDQTSRPPFKIFSSYYDHTIIFIFNNHNFDNFASYSYSIVCVI